MNQESMSILTMIQLVKIALWPPNVSLTPYLSYCASMFNSCPERVISCWCPTRVRYRYTKKTRPIYVSLFFVGFFFTPWSPIKALLLGLLVDYAFALSWRVFFTLIMGFRFFAGNLLYDLCFDIRMGEFGLWNHATIRSSMQLCL